MSVCGTCHGTGKDPRDHGQWLACRHGIWKHGCEECADPCPDCSPSRPTAEEYAEAMMSMEGPPDPGVHGPPDRWDNWIDDGDAANGSDGGFDRHGNWIIPDAMMEIVALRAKLEAAEGEQERLREGLKIARYSPLGDNHHNAAACPYCNPGGLTLDQLRARHAALREAADQVSRIWGNWRMNNGGWEPMESAIDILARRLAEAGGEGEG